MSNLFDDVSDDDLVTIPDDVDYVAELVGEGKKFKEVKDLAKGKVESDRYIEVLTKKLDDAVKELNTRTSLDTFLDKMKDGKPAQEQVLTPTPSGQSQDLDDSVLEAKLEALLVKRQSQSSAQGNMDKVTEALITKLGSAEQAKLAINHKAKDIGMSPAALRSIAEQSPSAFFKLMEITDSNPSTPSVPRSGVNSFGQENTVLRDKKFYERMKVQDPKQYFDRKTTSQMMKDMAVLKSKGLPW